jgi:hypothetical protein
MVDLFGVSSESFTVAAKLRRPVREAAPTCFTSDMIQTMFAALDVNEDGVVCAQDLDRWLTQQAAAIKTKSYDHHNPNAPFHDFLLDEVTSFLRAGASDPITLASPSPAVTHRHNLKFLGSLGGDKDNSGGHLDVAPMASAMGAAKDVLSKDGLTECLAHFPNLAFDWDNPFGVPYGGGACADGSSTSRANVQSRAFSREAAANLFRRLDSDSDGWVTAADLRVWRRMLPLGRSEDALVFSVLASRSY